MKSANESEIDDEEVPRPGFSRSKVIDKERLQQWRHPRLGRLLLDLALLWVQVALGVALYIAFPYPAVYLISFVLIAAGQQGISLASHEFAHYSVFPRNRKLNDLVGIWLYSAPILIPLQLFRIRHFEHHRSYSSKKDTKDIYRRDIRGFKLFKELLLAALGWDFISHLYETLSGGAGKPGSDIGKFEVLFPIAASQVIIFSVFCNWSPWYYLTLWMLPMTTLNWLLRKLRSIMEHQPFVAQGVEHETGYFRNTPGPYVRSVTASWWERVLLSHLNFCFHAEHHLWPSISYQYLPEVRKLLDSHDAYSDPGLEKDDTYLSTIVKLSRERN